MYVNIDMHVSVLMEQNFTDFVGDLASLTNKADNCVCRFGRVLSHGEQPPPKCILVAVSPESTKHQKPHPRRCRPPHVERSLTLSRSHRATCLTFPSLKKTSRKETKSDNGSYGHYLLSVKHAAAGVKNTNAQLPGPNDSRLT